MQAKEGNVAAIYLFSSSVYKGADAQAADLVCSLMRPLREAHKLILIFSVIHLQILWYLTFHLRSKLLCKCNNLMRKHIPLKSVQVYVHITSPFKSSQENMLSNRTTLPSSVKQQWITLTLKSHYFARLGGYM